MSIRHALLALLSEGPKYGLQMRDEFEQRTGEVWPLNVGQVYTTLQRLERDNLVGSDGEGEGPQKKSYRITPAGAVEHDVIQAHRRHVVELMQEWTRIKRDAAPDDLSLTLVVDAELFRLDSVIRWLDAAESRLRRSGTGGAATKVSRRPASVPARTQRERVGR